ncbi:glycosyltransferase [Glutamicibacter sp. ZJUTW]|uniref:glycosyltransferase n=1 Tax=Glutamicibacter sp. ZJUTW TaxID=1155384 RepID=UPI0011F10AE0|nr:glycosyltransferase [Glutamicibacter sp. ZJUTW]QEP06196.1 glycosyltransferase family 4 protein [Glutamicibacter sp. ZJUTW]
MLPEVHIAMFGPLPDQPTGLAMSVLRRAQAFAKVGTKSIILIDQFIPDIDRHVAGLKADGQLSGGMIEIRSMHLDLAGRKPLSAPLDYVTPRNDEAPGWEYVQDSTRPEVWRGYLEGDYQHFTWMRSETNVSFIDHLVNEGQIRVNRTWYDELGRPCKIELMDARNKPYKIQYMDLHGRVYLEESVNGSPRYRLIGRDKSTNHFNSYDDLYNYWLRSFVFASAVKPTLISEYGKRKKVLNSLAEDLGANVVYTFHSSHLGAPYTYGSPIRQDQREFISGIRDLPSLVVLTNEQKLDLEKQFGALDNVHVIPHHVPKVELDTVRDPNKIVLVGRFDDGKGHSDALKAFKRILERHPMASLEIYGRGQTEDSIRKEIADLGISESARIMGFTKDAASVFAGAAVAFVPSKYEGFCLSMIEAMSQGCVPVAYGFKYGPLDIIQNGVDGFIVAPGNISELADSCSFLLSNDSVRENMSDTAKKVIQRFSEERLISEWSYLFEKIGVTGLL